MLQKELSLGRIAGPFVTTPLDNLVISPLGIVPKKESGKYRLIHDLSYPRHSSVNTFIGDDYASVKYDTLDRVVELVQTFGQGALMAKVDIQEAFRIVPIHPSDRHLLGFKFDGCVYVDKCLPMGCRSSCQIFETLSTALQSAAIIHFDCSGITHILDDFIFVGPKQSSQVLRHLNSFLYMCFDCGIPIKESKTVLPTTVIQAHGIEVDSVAMELRLPQDKLVNAVHLLSQFSTRRKATLRELQSLIGVLNFACKAVRPGRPFLRRLIDLTTGVPNPNHHISITREARADMAAWLLFLRSFNGVSLIHDLQWRDNDALRLYTDASGSLGFAAVFGMHWFVSTWPTSLSALHITIKELFPIVLTLEIWGPFLANSKVIFKSDNMSVVHIINKQSSPDRSIMILVRRLVVAALQFNILFRAQHIPGVHNVVADRLSRFQFQEARSYAPWLDLVATSIPTHLLQLT